VTTKEDLVHSWTKRFSTFTEAGI